MRRILAVDDEPAVLRFAQMALERAGFTVLIANSGPEALNILGDHSVDALLTDVVMPGMSGPELILEARQRHPGLPVCCMTGYIADPHPLLQEIPVIRKPFDRQKLIDMLCQAMDARVEASRDAAQAALHLQMKQARTLWLSAIAEVDRISASLPSGIPSPDGSLIVKQAGNRVTQAFARYKEALQRYDEAVKAPD